MSNELAPWGNDTSLDYGKYADDHKTVAERTTPILHVVQGSSPESKEYDTARPGEVVMRVGGKDNPGNPNLGKEFRAVVIARGQEYVWWGEKGSDDEGKVVARCRVDGQIPEGCDPNDTKWPSDGGNARKDGKPGPVAELTRTFIVSVLDDDNAPGSPAMLTYSRGGAKTGSQLNMLLNAFPGPSYAAVLRFFTQIQHGGPKDEAYHVLKAQPMGQIMPDNPVLETLKGYHDQLAPLFA